MRLPEHTRGTLVAALLAVAFALLLTSCPNPLPVELVAQINDGDGPIITINEPIDRSEYSTVIRVSGTVADGGDSDATVTQIAGCSYSVPGTSVGGSFEIDEAGAFSFLFATRDADGTTLVAGPATIELTISDWSGNETTASVQIVPAATGDVPGFTVTPANGEATIAWDEVPGAASYDLFESKYGEWQVGVPNEYQWRGLENGEVYAFQVTARMLDGSGDDAVSATVETMPLSPRTLAPWISQIDYGSVTIEWLPNPNVDEYTVERSLSPDGGWETRRNLTATSFTDSKVEHSTEYYYRVIPSAFPDIPSDHIVGVPGRFQGSDVIYRSISGTASGVALAGSYAYVAAYDAGLAIIDVSDPMNPGPPLYRSTNGNAVDVVIDGNYAYIAVQGDGLAIIPISDPRNPGLPVYEDTDGSAVDVAVRNGYAYVAVGSAGLAIIDVRDPTDPQPPVYKDTTYDSMGVAVSGNYAYLTTWVFNPTEPQTQLAVIDVEYPGSPGDPDYKDLTMFASGIAVEGIYAYICDMSNLAVVNIENPLNPGDPVNVYAGAGASDVVLSDSHAYVGCNPGLSIMDLTVPSTPVRTSTRAVNGGARDLTVSGSYAYIAAGTSGLAIVDFAHPTSFGDLVNQSAGGAYTFDVAVAGSHAYLASSTAGLSIMEVFDPLLPGPPSFVDVGYANGVMIAGSHAYVSAGGLKRLEISKPATPGEPVSFGTASGFGAAVTGPYAYMLIGSFLQIVDISGQPYPDDPIPFTTGGSSYDAVVRGSLLYVADGGAGLTIVNIADPTTPSIAGTWTAGPEHADNARGIDVSGSYAYIANGTEGLAIVNISDLTNLTESAGSPVATLGHAYGVTIVGPFAFVADSGGGLAVIDISDPENPGAATYKLTGYGPTNVVVRGTYAYLADGDAGLAVIPLWEEPE